jgi:hypothetical protein
MRNRPIEPVEHGAAQRESGEYLPDLAQAGGEARPDHPGEGVPVHWVVWEPKSAQHERRRHVAERTTGVEARRRAVLDEPLRDARHAAELDRPMSARRDDDRAAVG